MTMRTLRTLACCLMVLGCVEKKKDDVKPAPPKPATGAVTAGANDDVVLFGAYGSMTGSEGTFGISTKNGTEAAVAEINAQGGLLGKKVRLISYDDQGKPVR